MYSYTELSEHYLQTIQKSKTREVKTISNFVKTCLFVHCVD